MCNIDNVIMILYRILITAEPSWQIPMYIRNFTTTMQRNGVVTSVGGIIPIFGAWLILRYIRMLSIHRCLEKYHINVWNNSLFYHSNLQAEATKANSLIEACMAGCWLNFACMLAGLLLILIQKIKLKQKQKEMDR